LFYLCHSHCFSLFFYPFRFFYLHHRMFTGNSISYRLSFRNMVQGTNFTILCHGFLVSRSVFFINKSDVFRRYLFSYKFYIDANIIFRCQAVYFSDFVISDFDCCYNTPQRYFRYRSFLSRLLSGCHRLSTGSYCFFKISLF
jgi:hypothetical protein